MSGQNTSPLPDGLYEQWEKWNDHTDHAATWEAPYTKALVDAMYAEIAQLRIDAAALASDRVWLVATPYTEGARQALVRFQEAPNAD